MSISWFDGAFTELRVIDLGAGNGMMGEVLKREGVARLVGADIIPEAREAAFLGLGVYSNTNTWVV